MRLLSVLLLFILILPACSQAEGQGKLPTEEISIQKADGTLVPLTVEMAVLPVQQATGMMGRTEIGDHEGMLFLFGDVEKRFFWMKNTLIPLDMLFISADGTIHHIHENAVPQDLNNITSDQPAKAVLELGGGVAKKLDIQVGDKMLHGAFAQ